ncbi:MAG: class I SAM-dependent methyltransferase [Pontiellaceae bacterium]|nr:class I SAM-dependent methyltransferase [Pontiellaceae bacterium]MBN2784148.1 class I SAM-dependent methyltransferase [Pontiellaceae bacterium]
MIENFVNSARYYDLLYKDKDYLSEVRYVLDLIKQTNPDAKSILSLGCGTGRHDILFAQAGYRVQGIDLSSSMTDIATARAAGRGLDISFAQGDIRELELGEKFDAVISLFHVMSYQTANEDLEKVFAVARNHLNPGGCFIFDTWHGPGVLTDRPSERTKVVEDDDICFERIARPVLHAEENVVDVHFFITVRDKESGQVDQMDELHRMRYIFTPEVKSLAQRHGFDYRAGYAWMTDIKPDFSSWNAVHVLGT